MAKGKAGAFGSRRGIPTPPVMIQGNSLKLGSRANPWFADLDEFYLQAQSLVTSAGMVLQYVDNPAYTSQVNRGAVNTDLKALTEHVKAFKGRLAIIKSEDQALRDRVQSVNPDNVLEFIGQGEKYQDFMNDWTRIVFFAIDTVLEHFRPIDPTIAYVCPFHPKFVAPVAPSQMTATQFEAATAPMTMGDLISTQKDE